MNKHKRKKYAKRKILLYAIYPSPGINQSILPHTLGIKPITFAGTYEEAVEIINKKIFLNHYKHYMLWCALKGYKEEYDEEHWKEYGSTVLFGETPTKNLEDEFVVEELYYTVDSIAAFIRMFTNSVPLFLPHEILEETINYICNNDITEDKLDPYLKALVEVDPKAKEKVKEAFEKISRVEKE